GAGAGGGSPSRVGSFHSTRDPEDDGAVDPLRAPRAPQGPRLQDGIPRPAAATRGRTGFPLRTACLLDSAGVRPRPGAVGRTQDESRRAAAPPKAAAATPQGA